MSDLLYALDRFFFYLINHTLSNPLFDAAFPWLTDINQHWVGRGIILAAWGLLLLRGGRDGRVAAFLLVPTFLLSDQLSSSVIKFIFDRPRPCHVLSDVVLLVPCGSGYSFPSSHAVNAFAAASVLSHFLRRWRWTFFSFAALMAFSRVYVGVHYPSDIVGGALIGMACGWVLLQAYERLRSWWLKRREPSASESSS